MAHIIRGNLYDKFANTVVEFSDDIKPLKDFFRNTPAHSLTITDAGWTTGTVFPPELVPKLAQITSGDRIYDWLTVRGGATLVSEAFKSCVEELEPSHHQFFPIEVSDKNGNPKLGPYYIFNIVGQIDSIIEEQSNLKPSGKGIIAAWGYEPQTGPWKCAMAKSVFEARACWTELHYPRHWFASDALATLLKTRELQGFDLDEYCIEL
jgi:hypothetical protein